MSKATGILAENKFLLWTFMAVFGIALFAFFFYQASLAFVQYHRNTTFQQVKATIVSTEIETTRKFTKGDKFEDDNLYVPVIHYRFEMDKQPYIGSNLYSIKAAFPILEEASEITDRYKEGMEVPAYYDPQDPSQNFLIKKYRLAPYASLQILLIYVPAMLFIFFAGDMHIKKVKKPRMKARSKLPGYTISSTTNAVRNIAYTCLGLCFAALELSVSLHYLSVSEEPDKIAHFIVGFFVSVMLFLLLFIFYFAYLRYYTREALLTISTDRLQPGSEVTVNVMQHIRKPLTIKEAKIGLIHEKIDIEKDPESDKDYRFDNIYEHWDSTVKNQNVGPMHPLKFEWKFSIPKNRDGSSLKKQKTFPKYNWFIQLTVTYDYKYNHNMEYERIYPIFVTE